MGTRPHRLDLIEKRKMTALERSSAKARDSRAGTRPLVNAVCSSGIRAGGVKRLPRGLNLDVFDAYTASTRPTSDISGGESSKAALALSLGMSDIIQQTTDGIRLGLLGFRESPRFYRDKIVWTGWFLSGYYRVRNGCPWVTFPPASAQGASRLL